MKEYIERKAALEAAKKSHLYFDIKSIINSVPAVDARPVVRGKWTRIDYEPNGHDYKCSACGWKNDMQTHYCPDCGAVIRG
jgi:predicted RNA-binding Zn-ribbon protein involved in translation (DUF1610 family)